MAGIIARLRDLEAKGEGQDALMAFKKAIAMLRKEINLLDPIDGRLELEVYGDVIVEPKSQRNAEKERRRADQSGSVVG
ncbi:hypothetical protein [Streptosporangium subroseum]|uniref:hypothetical protein n=1 Tax=Streptosporangium subroseum TaxID=106412 RepID=UPI00117CF097|nr:hypothetical protein [Streptosporangium subroseum]